MTKCGKCGVKNAPFSLYCEQCGSQIAEAQGNESVILKKLPPAQNVVSELKSYISSCLKDGHSMTQIKRALQREGYTDQEIQQGFIAAHKKEQQNQKEQENFSDSSTRSGRNLQNHPLAGMNRTEQPSIHPTTIFISLIFLVVIGGFAMMYMNNQNQAGLATLIASQQGQDLSGQASFLYDKQTNSYQKLEEQVTQKNDQLTVQIQELQKKIEASLEKSPELKRKLTAADIGTAPAPPPAAPPEEKIIDTIPNKEGGFMYDQYGYPSREYKIDGSITPVNINFRERTLAGSASKSVSTDLDNQQTRGEPSVFGKIMDGTLPSGTVAFWENLLKYDPDFKEDIFLNQVTFTVNDRTVKPFLYLEQLQGVILLRERRIFSLRVDLKQSPDGVPFYTYHKGSGDMLAGGNYFYIELPERIRTTIHAGDTIYATFYLIPGEVAQDEKTFVRPEYSFLEKTYKLVADYPVLS